MSRFAESTPGFLDRERIVARPGFNRWLVPPAALAVHLSIGEAYAFSVFKLPLTRLIGGDEAQPGNWTQPQIGWVFSIAIVSLGLSAAVFGRWLERAGPRKAMFASAALDHAKFAIDNGAAERAIRPVAVGRASWLQIGGDGGLATASVLLSANVRWTAGRTWCLYRLRDRGVSLRAATSRNSLRSGVPHVCFRRPTRLCNLSGAGAGACLGKSWIN